MIAKLKVLGIAMIVAIVGTAASAATFHFDDKYRYASAGNALTMTDGHLTMKVWGERYKDGKGYYSSVKTEEHHGLSVGRHWVDGSYGKEYAVFKFSHAVNMVGFGANYVNWYDDFSVYALVDGYAKHIAGGDLKKWNGIHSIASTKFWIGAADGHDWYKIRKLVVEKHVSEVPLPAGGVLLLSALGLVALRRKKA